MANSAAKMKFSGKIMYDRDFLMKFQPLYKERPVGLPSDEIFNSASDEKKEGKRQGSNQNVRGGMGGNRNYRGQRGGHPYGGRGANPNGMLNTPPAHMYNGGSHMQGHGFSNQRGRRGPSSHSLPVQQLNQTPPKSIRPSKDGWKRKEPAADEVEEVK